MHFQRTRLQTPPRHTRFRALLWSGMLAVVGVAAHATVTQQIEPAQIGLGEAAQLTIAASGDSTQPISPPMVAGLDFIALSQSQRVESVNGVTRASTAVTYQVIAHKAGVFNIPGAMPGAPSVVLTVAGAGGNQGAPGSAAAAPPATGAAATVGVGHGAPPRLSADGTAFVRLALPKHDLYVGETIPVDIQVGTRDGMVASMNGPPTLNGDAFVLDKLSSEPRRSTGIVDGEPFTIFTWHGALAAVKPGDLSLTMQTPLSVRVRTPARIDRQLLDNPDDFFNQALQGFFGGATQKDITVASSPARFTVLALPSLNRPADFSGAVGHFSVTSALTDDKAAVGDPLTLQLKIAGTGNFDRVATSMLHDPGHWKTYAPTATFTPADEIGAQGEKIFEQPLIATASGEQTVPSLTFSWFDPDARRYETAHTTPLSAAIAPAPADRAVAKIPHTAAHPALAANPPVAKGTVDGLRPDHVDSGRGSQGLHPLYTQPAYIAVPSLMMVAMSGVLLWLRRRDRDSHEDEAASLETEPLIRVMDDASSAGDAETFFKAARLALQRTFAPKWHLKPEAITVDDVEAHLDVGSDVARVFRLADETAYAGGLLQPIDFQRWKRLVLRRIHTETLS